MRLWKKSIAVCLLLGLLMVLAVPAFATEKTDYDGLFAYASEGGKKQLMDALVEDPVAFLEALAFQPQDVQHVVIYTVAREASIEEWTVVRYLISWATDGRELTQSEKNLVAALRYAIDYADYSFLRAYKSGDALDALLKESMTGHAARLEGISCELGEAIKGDAVGFVRALASQEEKVRERVLALMPYHCSWTMGNVLIDILNGIDQETLTAQEAATVDALLEQLAETPVPVVAVDPVPSELAMYLSKREPAQPEPTQEPEPTQTEATQAPTEEPSAGKTEPAEKGISLWWLVLIPIGTIAGFLIGKAGKIKE